MKKGKYYDILTTEGSSEATIFLYGYIGENYEYDPEKGWRDNGVKDIAFVQELERLAAAYPVIHVRINSPGGEVFHGSAIVTAIRNCPAEVHTWIDGVAASMAGIVWLAGKKRHMAKNGMLMVHSASNICWGNAKYMREIADTLDQFDTTLIISAADSTGMEEKELREKYFDYKDHWLTWNDVNAEGWLSATDDYKTEARLPDDIQTMSYHALCEFFNEKKHPEASGLLDKLKAAWSHAIAAVTGTPVAPVAQEELTTIPSPTDIQDMNLEEFKKSVGDGSLSLEEVKAHVASLTPLAAPAAPEPTPEPAPAPVATAPDHTATIAALQTEVQQLKAQVTAFGAQPGAGKAAPEMPPTDLPQADGATTPEAQLAAANALLAAAAARNEAANFVI